MKYFTRIFSSGILAAAILLPNTQTQVAADARTLQVHTTSSVPSASIAPAITGKSGELLCDAMTQRLSLFEKKLSNITHVDPVLKTEAQQEIDSMRFEIMSMRNNIKNATSPTELSQLLSSLQTKALEERNILIRWQVRLVERSYENTSHTLEKAFDILEQYDQKNAANHHQLITEGRSHLTAANDAMAQVRDALDDANYGRAQTKLRSVRSELSAATKVAKSILQEIKN